MKKANKNSINSNQNKAGVKSKVKPRLSKAPHAYFKGRFANSVFFSIVCFNWKIASSQLAAMLVGLLSWATSHSRKVNLVPKLIYWHTCMSKSLKDRCQKFWSFPPCELQKCHDCDVTKSIQFHHAHKRFRVGTLKIYRVADKLLLMVEFTRVKREIVTMVDYYNAHKPFYILKYQNFTAFSKTFYLRKNFYCVQNTI